MEKLAERRVELLGSNFRRTFMAGAFNRKELFRLTRGTVNVLAELERQNWIFGAVNDKNGRGDSLQLR